MSSVLEQLEYLSLQDRYLLETIIQQFNFENADRLKFVDRHPSIALGKSYSNRNYYACHKNADGKSGLYMCNSGNVTNITQLPPVGANGNGFTFIGWCTT